MVRAPRRRKLIDSKVQGAVVRRVVVYWIAYLLVVSAFALLLQALSDPFRPIAEHVREMWWTQLPLLITALLLLPMFVVDTIKLSHRFAGPVFGLRKAMREIASGGAPRALRFRQDDFWHDLADQYNAMIARLSSSSEEPTGERQTTNTSGEPS